MNLRAHKSHWVHTMSEVPEPNENKNSNESRSLWRRFVTYYHESDFAKPLIPLVILVAGSIALSPSYFLSPMNIKVILMQVTPLALIATGEMFAILMAGIDLSVESAQGLAAMVAALLTVQMGGDILVPILVAIGAATLVGMINGAIITKLKVYSFVTTMATYAIFRALILIISNKPIWGLHQYDPFTYDYGSFIPVGFVLAMVIIFGIYLLMTRTTFGRLVYGIGSNEEAVRLAGIRADLIKFVAFTIAGVLYGVGGVMLIPMTGEAVDPWSAYGNMIYAIAACVIGGIALTGGVGHALGPLLGAFILIILTDILNILGITTIAAQQIIIGLVLIGAAASITRELKYVK